MEGWEARTRGQAPKRWPVWETAYPGELMDLIDAKAWVILRNAESVEITDLQGTEASFTWFPEWWEIIEGTHPTIKSAGSNSTFASLRPGRSEYADFAGHLAGGAPLRGHQADRFQRKVDQYPRTECSYSQDDSLDG